MAHGLKVLPSMSTFMHIHEPLASISGAGNAFRTNPNVLGILIVSCS